MNHKDECLRRLREVRIQLATCAPGSPEFRRLVDEHCDVVDEVIVYNEILPPECEIEESSMSTTYVEFKRDILKHGQRTFQRIYDMCNVVAMLRLTHQIDRGLWLSKPLEVFKGHVLPTQPLIHTGLLSGVTIASDIRFIMSLIGQRCDSELPPVDPSFTKACQKYGFYLHSTDSGWMPLSLRAGKWYLDDSSNPSVFWSQFSGATIVNEFSTRVPWNDVRAWLVNQRTVRT